MTAQDLGAGGGVSHMGIVINTILPFFFWVDLCFRLKLIYDAVHLRPQSLPEILKIIYQV